MCMYDYPIDIYMYRYVYVRMYRRTLYIIYIYMYYIIYVYIISILMFSSYIEIRKRDIIKI